MGENELCCMPNLKSSFVIWKDHSSKRDCGTKVNGHHVMTFTLLFIHRWGILYSAWGQILYFTFGVSIGFVSSWRIVSSWRRMSLSFCLFVVLMAWEGHFQSQSIAWVYACGTGDWSSSEIWKANCERTTTTMLQSKWPSLRFTCECPVTHWTCHRFQTGYLPIPGDSATDNRILECSFVKDNEPLACHGNGRSILQNLYSKIKPRIQWRWETPQNLPPKGSQQKSSHDRFRIIV